MKITKVEVTGSEIKATLANGVVVDFSFHEDFLHVYFSSFDRDKGLSVSEFKGRLPVLGMTQSLDVTFLPRKE